MNEFLKLANSLRILAEEIETEETESDEIRDYVKLLTKMKGKEGLNKIKVFIDNQRIRKPIVWWLDTIDDAKSGGEMDFSDMVKNVKLIIKRDLPAAKFLRLILDYGVTNGFTALNRLLSKGRAKVTLMQENK